MSVEFILFITAIQLVVQYLIYKPLRDWRYESHSRHPKTLDRLPVELFIINGICTGTVCFLTSVGLVTGITNLFASAILGLIMNIQYKNYENSLLDGSYYKKLAEKKRLKELKKQQLAKIAEEHQKRIELLYKNM